MMFATFKLIGGVLCFLLNIVVMLRSDNIEDVIKDFVALEVISVIDDMMAATIDEELDSRVYMSRARDKTNDWALLKDYVTDARTEKMEQREEQMKTYFYLLWKGPAKAEKFRQIIEAMEDGNFEMRFSNF